MSKKYNEEEIVDSLIERYIKEIDDNDFDYIYDQLYWNFLASSFTYIGKFTEKLLEADINPLLYMDKIPNYYLSGAKKIEKLIVPDNIKKLGNHIVCDSSIKRVYVHGNLELNPNAWLYGHPHLQILSREYLDQLSLS